MQMLTVAQAAAKLGISPRGVRKRIQAGTLQAVKVGRDWVISAKVIEREVRRERRDD